jgi:endonuclease-3
VTEKSSQRLFELTPDAASLATAPLESIEKTIYPAGFYRNKARQLKTIAQSIESDHRGKVPDSLEGLLVFTGVGRKTANLVLGLGFGIPAICVDTHVHRISNRLGLVDSKNPEQTEYQLMDVLHEKHWIEINDLLVTFGQNQCHPTSPKCTSCPIDDLCPRIGVERFR